MKLIPDASAILCLAFHENESFSYGTAVVDAVRDYGGFVPSIFWYEIRNVLLVNERRGRISPEKTSVFLGLVEELPLAIETLPKSSATVELARQHGLSIYDADYLELSLRKGLPLATLDSNLDEAASKSGITKWVQT